LNTVRLTHSMVKLFYTNNILKLNSLNESFFFSHLIMPKKNNSNDQITAFFYLLKAPNFRQILVLALLLMLLEALVT